MFGYVTIYRKGLTGAEMERYQAYYCGLCQALGRQYGRTGQLALSYDMAFVCILLTALYDAPTAFAAGRCAPHPLKKRPRADNSFTEYAADMTAALAYYNFMDDWQDDHRRASLAQAQRLEPYLPALRQRWPRQMSKITAMLDQLNVLEGGQPRSGRAVQHLRRAAGRSFCLQGRYMGTGAARHGAGSGSVHLPDGRLR